LLSEGRLSETVELLRSYGVEKVGAKMLCDEGHCVAAMELLASIDEFGEAARIGLGAENYEMAARYFESSGDLVGAAQAHESAGKPESALRLYLKLGNLERVRALATAGVDSVDLLKKSASFLHENGKTGRAAKVLIKGGLMQEAGTMLEESGNLEGALKVYDSGGLTSCVAAVHEKQGDFRRAAFLLMKAGDFCEAAETLSRGGEAIQAARLFRRLGKTDEAMAVLDAVSPSAADFVEATRLTCTILEHVGNVVGALKRLEDLLERIGYSSQNEDIIYELVDLQMTAGDLGGAERTLSRAREDGMDHKVLTEQITELRRVTSELDGPGSNVDSKSASFRFPTSSRYKMASFLARGFHGELFVARDVKDDREVVLKILHTSSLPSRVARTYFRRESRAMLSLNHPNIVKVYEVGELGGRPFYTMEYVQGNNLLEHTQAGQRMPLTLLEKLSICWQICDALAHAHDLRILHRDVKLDNIMLTPEMSVKLLDFGLAKVLDENPHASQFIVGTPAYMSPEQLSGRMLDERTDIYSLGILMFRLFTGDVPFEQSKDEKRRPRTGPPPDPRQSMPNLPTELAEAIMRCLEPEPGSRFKEVREVAKLLDSQRLLCQ